MYTPPVGARRESSGSTHWSDVSFDTKFSERKVPQGSEYSVISRQKVLSARRVGTAPRERGAALGRVVVCCAVAHPTARTQSAATLSHRCAMRATNRIDYRRTATMCADEVTKSSSGRSRKRGATFS